VVFQPVLQESQGLLKIFFLINQQDARIAQILFFQNTLHVLGIFFAHHQEFSTVHWTLVYFLQV
jgi:hypothetical protein